MSKNAGAAAETRETHGFQAEVKQLLHLMVNALYSNKEIFLRELISNAADATDRLRFEALSESSLYEDDAQLAIYVDYDSQAGTITVTDNGIGMSRDEVVQELGTIARSGTAEFLNQLTGDQQKDAELIGQFGVGFYSAFIVAERVEVLTRRAGRPSEEGVRWESSGEGEFTIETIDRPQRGTAVILHLREGEQEFADGTRLRHLVRTYSDHISVPVLMPELDTGSEEESSEGQYETVNSATALWRRDKSEISEDEYVEFYKHIAHDFQGPLTWRHNKVEGKLNYISLLYLPSRAPFDLWYRDGARGLKLYVQRVFIMDRAEEFLPLYLRFIKGVLETSDLPLNISRELLQKDSRIESMRKQLTKRVLDMLSALAENEPENYRTFWREFGQVLKEGPAEDPSSGERIAPLLRFATTHTDSAEQDQSLADYVSRMREDQEKIYYITASSFEAARQSPHLEIFRDKGIEVLLLYDRIDEWLMRNLESYDGKPFQDVARGGLDIEAGENDDQTSAEGDDHSELTKSIQDILDQEVEDVRVTHRLTESPACLVLSENDIGPQMRQLLEAAGQPVPQARPVLEINPKHPLVSKLEGMEDRDRFEDLSWILFEQANLADGHQPRDPAGYVRRLNKLLEELA